MWTVEELCAGLVSLSKRLLFDPLDFVTCFDNMALNLPLADSFHTALKPSESPRDHDSTAFPSEAASRVWTRQASPDTDVTPVGRTADFQQLKAAVLRAKLERCQVGEEGSPVPGEEDEEESAVAIHRIAMAARRYATGSVSDSEEDDPDTVQKLCLAVRRLAQRH